MAANMLGPATDLYKNRFHAEYSQLDYTYNDDDYVIYPDVIKRRWNWHLPVGGSGAYSGPDFPSTAGVTTAQKFQFNIPNNNYTDPMSYRLYCKLTLGNTSTAGGGTGATAGAFALANYAHSVINQLTVRFTGSSSTVLEQVTNYNVFCSMFYKFYTTSYVQHVQASAEGYNTTAANRIWNGASFMLPINVGFFMSMRKYIPHIVLPYLQIEYLMERNYVATICQTTAAGSTGSPANGLGYYYMTVPMLVVKEVDVDPRKTDDLRRQIAEGQAKGEPIRLDFVSWTGLTFNIASGISGLTRTTLTGNFVGIRKVMFAMLNAAAPTQLLATGATVAPTGVVSAIDQVNSFTLGGWTATNTTNNTPTPTGNVALGSYRIQIGGRYFPDQEIYINPGNGTTTLTDDAALAYYLNMDAVGTSDNPWADIIQNFQGNATLSSSTDWVFVLSTEFDDAGLPVREDMVNSGPLSMLLNFSAATAANLIVYVFVNFHRCIHIFEGNRVELIDG